MIAFAHPLALLLAIPLIAFAVLVQRRSFANLTAARRRVSLAVRLAILLALVLSLGGTRVNIPQNRQAVVFVTDLSASDYGQRGAAQALIDNAARQRPSGSRLGIVDVGREPVVEQPVGTPAGFTNFQSVVDRQYTNLAGGLDLANALLPSGYQRRVVILSDGQQNVGDAVASARLLAAQGVRVDVAPLHVPGGAEVLVDRVDMPPQLHPHESFDITVDVRSTTDTTTGITVYRDSTLVGSLSEKVHAGTNQYVLQQSPLPPGFYRYRVEIAPSKDTQPENNEGTAFTTVVSAPRVLVIADQPSEAANVLASLRSTGIKADLKRPDGVTPDLASLQQYGAVVIVDTPAYALGPQLMAQLVPYVRDLGHGLVVLGGQNAYSMGGYGQTPLEQVLPVSTQLPKHQQQPVTAVALIIESLEADTQINISKVAGEAAIDLLSPQDYIAVSDAPLDGTAGWVVPMQHVTNKRNIDGVIDRMVPGDPDSYVPALQGAFDALKRVNAKVKHIILLGDGDAEDPAYQSVVSQIYAAGITVSTVSTNGLGRNDFTTMRNIARWGGGRNYIANDTAKIPQIFLQETRTVARLGVVQGKFFPQELSANPMVRDLKRVAPLFGYVATTPKPAAEVVLTSSKLDPILAAWQYGSGRSVAWTSDSAGLWTKDWVRLPGANKFWANLVSWTLPAAGASQLFVSGSSSQGQGHIAVAVPSSLGANPAVTANVVDPSRHATSIQLEPSAPGQFGGSFQEGGQGTYFVTVEARGAGRAEVGQVGMAVPYSPEYRTTGVNTTLLRSLAAAGGGSLTTNAQQVWRNNLQPVPVAYDLTLLLLLLALLLLPVDVGVRRLVMSRREWAELASGLPVVGARPVARAPAVPALASLRARPAPQRPLVATVPEQRAISTPAIEPAFRPEEPRPAPAAAEHVSSRLLAARRKKT